MAGQGWKFCGSMLCTQPERSACCAVRPGSLGGGVPTEWGTHAGRDALASSGEDSLFCHSLALHAQARPLPSPLSRPLSGPGAWLRASGQCTKRGRAVHEHGPRLCAIFGRGARRQRPLNRCCLCDMKAATSPRLLAATAAAAAAALPLLSLLV